MQHVLLLALQTTAGGSPNHPRCRYSRTFAGRKQQPFWIATHNVMTDGSRILTIPRHNPVNAFTMGGIARDAGLSVDEFRALL